MHSISHALASADAIASFIDSEIKREENKVGNAQEASESKAAKARAMAALKNMTSLVDGALAKLRSGQASGRSGGRKATVARSALTAAKLEKASELPASAQSLIKSMSADSQEGLGSQKQSLQDMAKAIEPIVDSFDDVLSKPCLDQFSATLNAVPVVGLKNNQIMYLAMELDASAPTGTRDVWTLFCSPPADADVSDPSKVNFFPFNGDFCFSAGTAVWRKRHRTQDDPVLKQAVDNWPKVYIDEWEKIGDNSLPATDLRSIIPFAQLDAAHSVVAFHLLILTQDGTMQVLTKDGIYAENTWATISYQAGKDGPSEAPAWTRIAYWDNNLVAVDSENNMWTVAVDFDGSTYSAADEASIPQVSELTATDVGPVTVQSDGYLYRRYVQTPPSGESEPVQEWTQWVHQDGVTRLGVASPGVLLDLQTLTQSLKARYITTQTALYPVVNKFHAFAVTHQAYLTQLSDAASQYAEASSSEQEELALQNGKIFVQHAQVWAKILNKGIGDTKETVNVMTQQLDLVKMQLAIQIQVLKDKLTGLKRTLDTQEEELDKLKAAFWGSIAAMFLGIVLGVIGLITGVGAAGLVACGGLFVAGLVSMAAFSVKISQLNEQIASTESQIEATTTAIDELTYVSNNFTNLDSMYGTLNQFWGRMYNDASDLQTMDDATAEQIGEQVLLDTSSIVAAQGLTAELEDAAQLYLDTLNKQGIHIPDDGASLALVRDGNEAGVKRVRNLRPQQLHRELQATITQGRKLLSNGDFKGYKAYMDSAHGLQLLQAAAAKDETLRAGLWFDVPALSSAASVFQGIAAQTKGRPVTSSARDVTAADVDNQIRIAGPVVVGMLNKTVATCQTVQAPIEKYKALSEAGDDAGIAGLKDTLLQEAIDDCGLASAHAAEANNAFVDVNHAATAYQEGLELQVNQLNAEADVKGADLRRQIQELQNSLSNNPEIRPFQQLRLTYLQMQLFNLCLPIESEILKVQGLEQSSVFFQNHSLTWTEMVQAVSSNLGGIYNILTAVGGQVMEDPTRYEDLMQVEWATIQQNATDVLSILAAQGVPTKSVAGTVRKAVAGNNAVVAEGPEHDGVVEALCASPDVASEITKQAEGADKFFSNVRALVQLPYLSTIGYWDDAQADKTTLLDVVTRLRSKYVNMASSEYSAVEKLRAMSLLQKTGAGLVAQGKESLEVFVKASSRNVNVAQQAAQATAAKFKDAGTEYKAVLQQIDINMDQIKQKIADVDVDITKLEEQERQKIIQIIADVIALAFATATLLESLGVFAPVEAALTTAEALSLGAKETAAAVKTALDSVSLADISQAISRLQAVKRDLDSSLSDLQAVEPLFAATVDGVVSLESATTEAADALDKLLGSSGQWEQVSLTDDDVGKIGDSWDAVFDACTQWLDVVNAQGISPRV